MAQGICMALHTPQDGAVLKGIAMICEREDVLYSYIHTLIAWDGNEPAGICLCYDGGRYHEMRMRTFPLFDKLMQNDSGHKGMDLENAEDEAVEGEYYVDSLAVLPQYRRRGIGRMLLEAQVEKAKLAGFNKITLLVDPKNTSAQKLYKEVGFREESEVYAFGQMFWKWIIPLD